jgi:hypothetical protein
VISRRAVERSSNTDCVAASAKKRRATVKGAIAGRGIRFLARGTYVVPDAMDSKPFSPHVVPQLFLTMNRSGV